MRGKGGGKLGLGPIYVLEQQQLALLQSSLEKTREQIEVVNRPVASILNDRTEETRLASEFATASRESPTDDEGTLTAEEQSEKVQLQSDMAQLETALAKTRTRENQIQGALAHLPEEFALATRSDSLSQA